MKTRFLAPWLLSVLLGAFGLGGCGSQTPSASHAEATNLTVTTEEVTYASGDTTLKGFIAYPATTEKRPGVLVVHEWWGLNDYVRSRAKQLAEMGYVASHD